MNYLIGRYSLHSFEEWGKEYNHVRPHSALDYRPPAPEATIPLTLTQQLVLFYGARALIFL